MIQESLLNLVMPETMCLDLVFLLDHAGQVILSSEKVCCSLFIMVIVNSSSLLI